MDFMILYESRARELESACILKNALKSRGFSVGVYSIYSLMKNIRNAKVIIVPHLYDDKQVFQFICKYKPRRCRVINLQYEQVLSEQGLKAGYGYPQGQAANALLLAWGEHEKNRYKGDDKQECKVTGCLAMDLNLPKYDKLYLSKEYLCNKYRIDTRKKLLVFISSFALANVTDEYLRLHYKNRFCIMKKFAEISHRSQKTVIEWLKKIAVEEGWEVVYRPHPAEYENSKLRELEKSLKGFHIIQTESVRQWIRIADQTVTWFSTSVVDAYYAMKPCIILRPEKIPEDLDVPFMIDAQSICTYDDFVKAIKCDEKSEFPIKATAIGEFYSNERGCECLSSVVSGCIKVYNSKKYEYKYSTPVYYKNIALMFKTFIVDVLFELSRCFNLTDLYKWLLKNNEVKKSFFMHVQKELYKYDKVEKNLYEKIKNE